MVRHLRRFKGDIFPACGSNRSDGRMCFTQSKKDFIAPGEAPRCKRCLKLLTEAEREQIKD